MVRHCGLWRNHVLRHRSKCWECTFQMRYTCHYLECIHTYDPGSHNIQTRHIHPSCLLFHHLLSTFQRTHHFYNKVLGLNNTFHLTNHHSFCRHCKPTVVLYIPTSLHNHHHTCNNHIRTVCTKDNRTFPRHSCQDSHSSHCIPTIVLCIPSTLHNHHQTCSNHIRTCAKDNRTFPRHSCQDSHSSHCIPSMMAHRTLVKVWNLRN